MDFSTSSETNIFITLSFFSSFIEKDIIKMLEYNLKNEGFKTLSVRNGEDAIDSARGEHPDIIILDLMLPGIKALYLSTFPQVVFSGKE